MSVRQNKTKKEEPFFLEFSNPWFGGDDLNSILARLDLGESITLQELKDAANKAGKNY